MARKTNANESKADKFKRLANKRAVRAIKMIRGLGSLSGRAYEWKPDQVEKVFAALESECKAAKLRFNKDAQTPDEIKVL